MGSNSIFEAASVRNATEPVPSPGDASGSASLMMSREVLEPGRGKQARNITAAWNTTGARELSSAEEPSGKKTLLASSVRPPAPSVAGLFSLSVVVAGGRILAVPLAATARPGPAAPAPVRALARASVPGPG